MKTHVRDKYRKKKERRPREADRTTEQVAADTSAVLQRVALAMVSVYKIRHYEFFMQFVCSLWIKYLDYAIEVDPSVFACKKSKKRRCDAQKKRRRKASRLAEEALADEAVDAVKQEDVTDEGGEPTNGSQVALAEAAAALPKAELAASLEAEACLQMADAPTSPSPPVQASATSFECEPPPLNEAVFLAILWIALQEVGISSLCCWFSAQFSGGGPFERFVTEIEEALPRQHRRLSFLAKRQRSARSCRIRVTGCQIASAASCLCGVFRIPLAIDVKELAHKLVASVKDAFSIEGNTLLRATIAILQPVCCGLIPSQTPLLLGKPDVRDRTPVSAIFNAHLPDVVAAAAIVAAVRGLDLARPAPKGAGHSALPIAGITREERLRLCAAFCDQSAKSHPKNMPRFASTLNLPIFDGSRRLLEQARAAPSSFQRNRLAEASLLNDLAVRIRNDARKPQQNRVAAIIKRVAIDLQSWGERCAADGHVLDTAWPFQAICQPVPQPNAQNKSATMKRAASRLLSTHVDNFHRLFF